MLREIILFIKHFRKNDDMRQFSINVAADLFVEMLENNQELKEQIINNFRK